MGFDVGSVGTAGLPRHRELIGHILPSMSGNDVSTRPETVRVNQLSIDVAQEYALTSGHRGCTYLMNMSDYRLRRDRNDAHLRCAPGRLTELMAESQSPYRHLRALHRRSLGRAGQRALRRRRSRDRAGDRDRAGCQRRPGRIRPSPRRARLSTPGSGPRPHPTERSRCLQQLSDALLARGDEIYALAQTEWGCTANERLIQVDGPAFMVGRAAELALEPVEAPVDVWGPRAPRCCGTSHSVWWRR